MSLCSRKAAIIASISCLAVILILGITALVFRQKGYLAFNEPCVGLESFRVIDFDIQEAAEEEDGNSIVGFLDSFTGGLASEFARMIPTQATITIRMILEFNNTNPYDLECEQSDTGVIEMLADNAEEEDLAVGTWNIASSTLEGNARSEIPVEVTATINLLSDGFMGLGVDLVTGRRVAFRITGGILGFVSWAPDVEAHVTLACLANVDDIFDLESGGADVTCRHSVKVGQILATSGEMELDGEEVDSACLV